MAELIPRHICSFAHEVLDTFPAVMIQGARQVGKSTFATELTRDREARILTLDDDGVRAAALYDPTAFVEQLPDGVLIIDEVQRAPDLVLAVKASIDRNRRAGRFVLTGSSNLLRMSATPDSLAGRAITIELRGLSQGELARRLDDFMARLRAGVDPAAISTGVKRDEYVERIARGGYPEVQTLSSRMRNTWFDSYVERLLERDVSDLAPRVDSHRLGVLLRLLAANQAGELVKARIARDASIPETSVTSPLDLLERLYLTSTIRAWTPNLTSREAARPKVVVADPGLALRASRVSEEQLRALGSSHLGAAMEGFVVTELLKQRTWSQEEFELFHFRDRDGLEVDIVIEFRDGAVLAFEVKSGSTVKAEHFKGLRFLRDQLGDRFVGGYVLNTAEHGMSFGDRLGSLPVAALWEV